MSLNSIFNNRENKSRRLKNIKRTSLTNKNSILNKITQYTETLSRNMKANNSYMQNNQLFTFNSNHGIQQNNHLSIEPNLLFSNFDREILKQKPNSNNDKEESCERTERIKCRIETMFQEVKVNKYNCASQRNYYLINPNVKFHHMYKLPRSKLNKLIEINRILDKPLREPYEIVRKSNDNKDKNTFHKATIDTNLIELEEFSKEFNRHLISRDNDNKSILPRYNRHSRNQTLTEKIDKRNITAKTILSYSLKHSRNKIDW